MPPKKRKIIKKRKITKADVKRIPKVPVMRPNINLSPYDIATMVQQKFKQDMEADNINIERRQAELAAQKKAIESPEFQKALDANTKSLMSLQQEMQMVKSEQQRQQVDAQRAFQQSPEFQEMMSKITKIRQDVKHSEDMQRAELDRLQANIVREMLLSQETHNQRLEKAIAQRNTDYMRDMNALYEQQAKIAADAEAREQTRDELIKKTLLEHETRHMEEMNKLEERHANALAEKFAITQDSTQRLERAIVEQQTKQYEQVNARLDKLQNEKAKYEAQTTEQEGEYRVGEYKRTKDTQKKLATDRAKAKRKTEFIEERIEIQKQANENIKRKAYYDELKSQGAADSKEVGEERAQQELERRRIERETESEKQRQKTLLEQEVVAKQNQKIISDLQSQIQQIKSSDPTSRLTGDPSLIEADLFILGDEKKRYEQAQREAAQARVYQHAILDMNKEVDALAKEINDTGQGITFSELYTKSASGIIQSMADLVQMRQGRKVFSENIDSIFPAVQARQREIEKEAQALANQQKAFEYDKAQLNNKVRDTEVLNQRLKQQLTITTEQLAVANQQLAMATGRQPPHGA